MPSYTKHVNIPGKPAQELYETVSEEIEQFLTKASVGRYQLERNPKKKEIRIKSSLFSATLSCSDGEMALDGQISLIAVPLRSKIDAGIDRWIAKTFNLKHSVS